MEANRRFASAFEQGKRGNRIMTRNISRLIVLLSLATTATLRSEPTPSPDPSASRNANRVESQNPRSARIAPTTSLVDGWNYVKGEWIHSDGYKYINGQVIRTTAQTHKRPPKPPSRALLNSVKTKPGPTPDPNSAAAKAAEKERNLRPRPASQTGTHL
jgi:hypothetical protein